MNSSYHSYGEHQRQHDRILLKLDTIIYQDIDHHEGLRLKPYKDTVGKWSIGWGRNLDDVGISREEAEIMRDNDIFRTIELMDNYLNLDWRHQPYPVMRALFNMCFQMGVGGVNWFKGMLRALALNDYERAAAEALDSRWAVQTPERAEEVAEWIRSAAEK